MRRARQSDSAKRRRPARAWPRFRRLAFEPLEARRLLAVLTVNSTGDAFDLQDGAVTLREAILAANTDTQTELGDQASGADEIRFAPSLFSGGPATLLLLNGELVVTRALTISGPGANLLTIDAQQQSRIFNFTAFTDACTLTGMTLTGGRTTGDNGDSGSDSSFSGGAVRSQSLGNLTLNQCVVTGNRTEGAGAGGGGVFADGSISIIGSTISGNQTMGVSAPGGGLYARGGIGLATGALSGDSAAGDLAAGGGVVSFFVVNISGSTISGNSTAGNDSPGGGLRAAGHLSIVNSTISGNFTQGSNSDGGGFDHGVVQFPRPSLDVRNSTIAGNSTQGPGSAGGGFVAYSDSISLANSIVANNAAGAANPELLVDSTTFAVRYSLIRNVGGLTPSQLAVISTGPGNITNQDPLLLPLGNNGGPTQTLALLAGSPAIDAGDPGFQTPPEFDQRGDPFGRIVGGRIDMGAYESDGVFPNNFIVDIATDELDGDYSVGDLSLREALWVSNLDPEARTIAFASNLNGATIELSLGELLVSDTVTINANNLLAGLTVDASGNDPTRNIHNGDGTRVFRIDDGNSETRRQVVILGLTLTGGDVSGNGGAIFNREDLAISRCTIANNSAEKGGGIYSDDGALAIANCTLNGNAANSGGGIYVVDGALNVVNSTLSGNTADHNGGGMALYLNSQNSTASIRHSTITGNVSDFNLDLDSSGGGVYARGAGQLEFEHTIIAGNIDNSGVSPDLDLTTGPLFSLRLLYSLIGNNAGSGLGAAPVGSPNEDGNLIGDPDEGGVINPRLDPLADNGGPTRTHQLQSNSPAIDAGIPNAVAAEAGVPLEDQRGEGFSRIIGQRIDMGAFEVQTPTPPNSPPIVANPIADQAATVGAPFEFTFAANTFTDADGDPLTYLATLSTGGALPAWLSFNAATRTIQGSPTAGDIGPITVRVTADDGRDGVAFDEFILSVTTNPPVVTVPGPQTVNEGDVLNLATLVSFSDPDTFNTHEVTINWGDGTPDDVVTNAPIGFVALSHVYADDGMYTVTATVSDDLGGSDSKTFEATVNNVDPTLTGTDGLTVDEGQSFTLTGLGVGLSDPGFDTETFADLTIDWGDGTAPLPYKITNLINGAPLVRTMAQFDHAPHAYTDDGTYTVTVTVQDDDGPAVSRQFSIVVGNVPPTLTVSGPANVNEGTGYVLDLSAVDPGFDEITSWTINWGDSIQVVDGDPAFVTHVYADGDANFVVSATATDEDGTYSAGNTVSVSVQNVVPTLTLNGLADVNEGSEYRLNLSSLDPGGDEITSWTINWGDRVEVVTGDPAFATHVYPDGEANFVISATATDEDGTHPAGNTVSVAVHNVPPTLRLSGPAEINEGSIYTLTLSSADPGPDTIASWTINWGDGDSQLINGSPASAVHVYADGDANFTVSASAADEDGTHAAGNTVSVAVRNVVPTLNVVSDQNVDSGEALSLVDLAAITDPGFANLLAPSATAETFRVYLDWGDGTIVTGTATIDSVGGNLTLTRASFDGNHVYDTADTFQVTVRIADDDMSGNFATGASGIDFIESSFAVSVAAVVIPFELPLSQPPDPPTDDVIQEALVLVGDLPSLLLGIPPASLTRFPESDGGAGGGVPAPLLFEAPLGARSILDERVMQAAYYRPSAIKREEVVDAVFTLGDIEQVSLVGVDMGDDPVLGRKRKAAPAESDVPVDEPAPAMPLIADVPVPELPAGPSWNSLAFWAALAGSGTLWLGGTWWWMRRGRKMGQK